MSRNHELNHGPGKGSRSRTKFDKNWRERFDEIKRTPSVGFEQRGVRQIKRYPNAQVPPV
jgi:hypothetical protein